MSRFVTFLGTILVLTLASGCGLFGGTDNHAPIIREITIEPRIPQVNTTASINADVVDGDGDSLRYEWSSPAGSFPEGASTENPTDWLTPSEKGTYEVTCTVDDGTDQATETITVQIGLQSD